MEAPSSAPLAGAGAGLCVVMSSCALATTTIVARRNREGSKRRGANPDRDICEFDERFCSSVRWSTMLLMSLRQKEKRAVSVIYRKAGRDIAVAASSGARSIVSAWGPQRCVPNVDAAVEAGNPRTR